MEPPQFKIIGPDGRESAPFDVTSLLSYARQGYIQPHTMIYDMQQARWMPAAEHPALGGAQPAAAYEGAPSGPTPAAAGPQPPRPAGKTGLVVAIVSVCLIVLLAAGYGLVRLGRSVGLSSSETAQTVTAEDGRYAVTVPAG